MPENEIPLELLQHYGWASLDPLFHNDITDEEQSCTAKTDNIDAGEHTLATDGAATSDQRGS